MAYTARTSRAVPGLCTQQHARGVKPSLIIFIMSVKGLPVSGKDTMVEATLTVVEDIKHLGGPVLCNAGE